LARAARAGVTVTFWVDQEVIHLTIGGARVKTVRSPHRDLLVRISQPA
jgi:hypothetical protein